MEFDLAHRDALSWVDDEHSTNQIADNSGDIGRNGIFSTLNQSQQVPDIWVIEGELASVEGKQNDAAAPHISEAAIVLEPFDNFRGSVMRRATRSAEKGVVADQSCHTKVRDFDRAGEREQNVFRL